MGPNVTLFLATFRHIHKKNAHPEGQAFLKLNYNCLLAPLFFFKSDRVCFFNDAFIHGCAEIVCFT